jgi:hypothetical protein
VVAAAAWWRVVHRSPDAAFQHGGRRFCVCVVVEIVKVEYLRAGLGPLISWQLDHK